MSSRPPDNRRELLRYAGLSTEILVSVGLAVFLGLKADKWAALSFPIFSWALPLLVIGFMLYKLIKASPKDKNSKNGK